MKEAEKYLADYIAYDMICCPTLDAAVENCTGWQCDLENCSQCIMRHYKDLGD